MLQAIFLEDSLRLMLSDGPIALSPFLWVSEVQVSKRPAEDTYPPFRCPPQLALAS